MRTIYVDDPRTAKMAIQNLNIRNRDKIRFTHNNVDILTILEDETAELIPNAEHIQFLQNSLHTDYLNAFAEYLECIDRLQKNNDPQYYVMTMAVWREGDDIVFEW